MADGVVIKIKGDDSHYKSTLSGLKSVTSKAIKGISLATGALTTAWNAAGLAVVNYNGNIEQLQTSFEVMTGSAAKGAEVLERIRALGASTPFEMEGLAETVQLLMNYNLTADDAISKMTMLGDISQGNQDKLTRIATAYGQMSSASKVSLEDVKQMIEAGFNPLVEISETTGESMASLYNRISKGTLAVDEITASMERSTSAGGKYFQSMEKQSQTLNGQISTLKDNAQQLAGNMFQGYTDGLRDSVVPAANEIVEELNDALLNGGMDGLTDAVLDQLPGISSAVGDALTKGINNAGKQAPKIVKGLISAIPSLLSSGGEIAGSLTDVFFDVAEAGLEGLAANAPELADIMLDTGLDLAGRVVSGVTESLIGAGKGIGTALKKTGVLGWSTDELIDQIFDGYDEDRVAELRASVNIEPEVTVDESKAQLTSVYDMIEQQLTDGLADTPEVIDELKQQVTDYYTAEIEKVNEWKNEALAELDTTLPADEYAAATAAIEAEAADMTAALQSASDQTVKFITDNAGKSTEAVQANLDQLEKIYQEAVGYRDKVAALTGEAGSMADRQRQVVASGQSRDESTQLAAIGYTAMEYQAALEAAEAEKEAAIQKALSQFEEGTNDYKNAEEKIRAEYEASEKAAQEAYLANMNQLWSGIAQAMAPEQQEMLQEVTAALESRDIAQQLMQSMNTAIDEVGAYTDAGAYTDWFSNMLEGMALSDTDYTNLATALGIDEIDPAAIQAALAEQLASATAGQGANSQLGVALQDLITSADGNFQAMIPQLMEGLPEEIKNVAQASIEEGWLLAVGEVDLTDDQTLLTALAGTLSSEDAATIGKTAGEAAGSGVAEGAASMVGAVTTSGVQTMAGFIAGMESKRSDVIAKASSIASAAAGAIRRTLLIRSPSRVTMQLGEYAGEGFDIGISNSLRGAVKSAETIVGSLNLSPKLTAPDLTGAFGDAAETLAASVNVSPVLVLNGHTVAQTLAGDNARASSQYNRNIALGVGK